MDKGLRAFGEPTRRFAVPLVVMLILVIAAGAVILKSQGDNERSIRTLSTHYMEEVAARAWSAVERYLGVAPRCLELIQERDWTDTDQLEVELEALYRRLLRANPEIEMLNWGRPDGSFLMVKRMPDDTFSTKRVVRRGDIAESVWRHENPRWATVEGFTDLVEDAAVAYDPRRRGWYQQAVQTRSLGWTDPYIFYTDRIVGIGCGAPLLDEKNRLLGVVAADLRIDDLVDVLEVAETTAGRKIAIVAEDGAIIAHPELAARGADLVLEVEHEKGSRLVLRRLSESADQVMAHAFALRPATDDMSAFAFSHQGEAWVARFDAFRVHPTRSWIVAVLEREDNVLGSLRRHYKTTLAVALACLVLSIGLAMAVLAREQREQLAREQQKLDHERRTNRRLRDLDQLKDDFLANTSHELRTPLFGIAGLAEALMSREKSLPEASQQDLSLIISSCRRLTTLVNDVLDFSKLRRHELAVETQEVDLCSVADVVLTLSSPLVGPKDLRLVNKVPRDLPCLRADEARLQQILHNLVGNAVEFTDSGSVELGAEAVADHVVVSVRDTGPGIPVDDQERIFRSFEQGAVPVRREHGGTGLGLSVSRQLVELQGGRLWLESEVGEGSTFRFSLPIWRPVDGDGEERGAAASRPVVEPPEPEVGSEPAETHTEPVRLRILIVDDEPVNLRVLTSYLADSPYEVAVAASGPEALELLGETPVDLVLLDIMMPKMSGFEVCRQIRRRWSLEELPVLFLTAKAQVADRVAGFAEGANDYLIKPVERSELLARIGKEEELLRQHRGVAREVQTLSGLVPICASCKRIRDDEGYWEKIESYLSVHSSARFSAATCPNCVTDGGAAAGRVDDASADNTPADNTPADNTLADL